MLHVDFFEEFSMFFSFQGLRVDGWWGLEVYTDWNVDKGNMWQGKRKSLSGGSCLQTKTCFYRGNFCEIIFYRGKFWKIKFSHEKFEYEIYIKKKSKKPTRVQWETEFFQNQNNPFDEEKSWKNIVKGEKSKEF